MNSLPQKPHEPFMKLLFLMDELRRNSFKLTPPGQQQKMLGLTLRQGSALAQIKLLTSDHPQGVALKTLASSLKMTVPATSLLVESMVNKGFFERNPNPDDRRAVCIRLSEKGLQLCDEINARIQDEMDRLAADISPEELAVFSGIVDKIQHKLYA